MIGQAGGLCLLTACDILSKHSEAQSNHDKNIRQTQTGAAGGHSTGHLASGLSRSQKQSRLTEQLSQIGDWGQGTTVQSGNVDWLLQQRGSENKPHRMHPEPAVVFVVGPRGALRADRRTLPTRETG